MSKISKSICVLGLFFLCASAATADFSAAAKNLSNSAGDSMYPKIAGTDGSPNVFVIWMEYVDATTQRLYFARSTDNGQTWSVPDQLITWGQIAPTYPQFSYAICVEEPYIHVVLNWRADDADDWEIRYKRSDDLGQTWDSSIAITDNTTPSLYPDVAARGSYVHVTFQDNWPGNDTIMYKRITNYGAGAVDQTRRLTYSATNALYPKIAVSQSGISVNIVYEDLYNGAYNIFYKHIYGNGTGSFDTAQLTFGTGSFVPDVTTSAGAGDNQYVYIVYHSVWPGQRDIMYKRLDRFGEFSLNPPITIYTARLTYSTTESRFASVDFDSVYNYVHISYNDPWPGNEDVMYRKLSNYGGAGFSGQRVSWGTGDSSFSAPTSSGAWAFIVWMDNSSGNYEIYVKYGT